MYNQIKVIAFDADDTLWENETYFREAEHKFAELLSQYEIEHIIDKELYKKEIENLKLYGYGIKGFVLSMIECALEISNFNLDPKLIQQIIDLGKDMLNKPINLIEGVEDVLKELNKKYKLIVATKGDLLDQERKLKKSNILKYFHHVEVMSDKKEDDYIKLIKHLDINPNQLLMVGNSLKSDVLPLIKIGANAIHIPFHTTWTHETVPKKELLKFEYHTLTDIKGLLSLF